MGRVYRTFAAAAVASGVVFACSTPPQNKLLGDPGGTPAGHSTGVDAAPQDVAAPEDAEPAEASVDPPEGGGGGADVATVDVVDASVPVTITIGETNVLAADDSGNADLLVSQQATLARTATIQSLSFYVTTADGNLRLGIYDDTGPAGGPGVKRAETSSVAAVAGWNTLPVVTSVSLAPGTYWLAYLPSSNALGFKKEAAGMASYVTFPFGTMASPFPAMPTTETVHWSLYATLKAP